MAAGGGGGGTHMKSTMPVLAMAKDRPRMPLPMMALLRLKTDIPKEVWPGCCSERRGRTSGRYQLVETRSRKCRSSTPG